MTTEALNPKVQEFASTWAHQNLTAMKIQGFGPDDPPPPPFDPAHFREVKPVVPGNMEEEEPQNSVPTALPQSPLISLGQRLTRAPEVTAQTLAPSPKPDAELWVEGPKALFRGQPVDLTASEQAAIAQIVLRAIRHRIDQQYSEVVGTLPRRVRVRRQEAAPVPPKPKRGRPRKVATSG